MNGKTKKVKNADKSYDAPPATASQPTCIIYRSTIVNNEEKTGPETGFHLLDSPDFHDFLHLPTFFFGRKSMRNQEITGRSQKM